MSQKSVLEKCLQKSPKVCRKKVSWIFFVCAATCGKGLLNKDSQKSVLEKCPQKSPKICRKKVSWIFCMCGHLWEGSLCGGPDSDHSWVEILRGHTVEKSGAQHKSGEKPSTKVEKSPAAHQVGATAFFSLFWLGWCFDGEVEQRPFDLSLIYILMSIRASLYPPYIIFHDWDVLSRYFLHSVKRRLTFKIYKTLLILLVLHPVFDTKMVVATLVWWRKRARCNLWLAAPSQWQSDPQRIVTLKSSYRLIAH